MATAPTYLLPLLASLLLCAASARSRQLTAPPVLVGTAFWSPSTAQEPTAHIGRRLTEAQEKLKTFRSIFVYSDTVYLDTKVLQHAMMKRFEIQAWRIAMGGKDSAEIQVKVTRPFLTFDWVYRMTDATNGTELGAGRIVAWDGDHAADAIAADIARTIARVRALPTHIVAAFAEDPNARNWQVAYVNGSEGPRNGEKITISISPERIVGRRQSRVLFVIPAGAVSGIGYNPRSTDPSKQWDVFWETLLRTADSPDSAMGALMLIPVALGGEAILKQFKSTEHLCEITWIDYGAVRNVILKPDAKDAEQFVAALCDVSNRKAIDIGAETAALTQAIETAESEGRFIPLQLDRKALLGWKALETGDYHVIVLGPQPGHATAYFLGPSASLPPGVNPIAAQIPVEVEERESDVTETQVRYRETNGIASIEDVITAARVLHFRAVPLQLAAEPQIPDEMEDLLAEAALRPKYRSIHVRSDTVYLDQRTMEQALAQHPAVAQWEVTISPRVEDADLVLLVTRPFLTFDWKYTVTEVKTGKKVIDGKITARDGGRAATLIADQFVNGLKATAARQINDQTN